MAWNYGAKEDFRSDLSLNNDIFIYNCKGLVTSLRSCEYRSLVVVRGNVGEHLPHGRLCQVADIHTPLTD